MTDLTKDTALADLCRAVLETSNARAKAEAARAAAGEYHRDPDRSLGTPGAPTRPARPPEPVLSRPGDVPRRRINRGIAGRIALLHALAHIELNAIDLAFDIVARFADAALPRGFFEDWLHVGDDEARHFLMLDDRLRELGSHYGALLAHDGLWQASMDTAHDLTARLAIVPMVLEARGLDVTPAMIEKLTATEDHASAAILQTIHDDEITHVAVGTKWFRHLCESSNDDPVARWHDLVKTHFKGQLKPPFNQSSRDLAGLTEDYTAPWTDIATPPPPTARH